MVLSVFENPLPWEKLHEVLVLNTEGAKYYDMRQLQKNLTRS